MANKVTENISKQAPKELGKRLAWIRQKRGEKQEDVASKVLNVSRISLAYYENDERTIPIDAIKKLALHYKVSTDFILGLSSAETDDITDNQISKSLGITSQSINLIRTAHELAMCEAKWKTIISDKIKKGSLTAEDFNVGKDIERASNIIKSIETLNYSQTIFLNKAKEIIDYINEYEFDETEV